MPKGYLIVGIPENCEECKFHYNTRGENNEYDDGYVDGWNLCLNKILGK